ncbi:MAG: hypothetical protein LBL86_11415 [Coriobacteriales bacterium]|jgi:hypothetical protein|nr:hypothetical protein [Coriobacteriales bacterium]
MTENLLKDFSTLDHDLTDWCRAAFREVEASLVRKTGIRGIRLPVILSEHLDNPADSAAKVLLAPCVSLLQRRITEDEIEQFVRVDLASRLTDLSRCLYEAWIAYGLIDLLEPTEFKGVMLMPEGDPRPCQLDYLELGFQMPDGDLRLPEALFTTALGEQYAYKFESVTEIAFYRVSPRRREFSCAGNTVNQVCHRAFLLYRRENSDEVPIIASREKRNMLSPDLMVEHLSADEYASELRRKELSLRIQIARPNNPLQVVFWQEQPEGDPASDDSNRQFYETSVVGTSRVELAKLLVPLTGI